MSDLVTIDSPEIILLADRIKCSLRRTGIELYEIGCALDEAKAKLPHGSFQGWHETEFNMSRQAASEAMNVARTFSGQMSEIRTFGPSVLKLLASPSTPETVREQAQAKADSGEHVSVKEVEAMKARHKEAEMAAEERGRRSALSEVEGAKARADAAEAEREEADREANRAKSEVKRIAQEAETEATAREQKAREEERTRYARKEEALERERRKLAREAEAAKAEARKEGTEAAKAQVRIAEKNARELEVKAEKLAADIAEMEALKALTDDQDARDRRFFMSYFVEASDKMEPLVLQLGDGEAVLRDPELLAAWYRLKQTMEFALREGERRFDQGAVVIDMVAS